MMTRMSIIEICLHVFVYMCVRALSYGEIKNLRIL